MRKSRVLDVMHEECMQLYIHVQNESVILLHLVQIRETRGEHREEREPVTLPYPRK